ncbi:hypothetical protein GCM10009304_26260 [Pseudomonas matsuisoli]|uniref:Uncharacterized protein n=1 Tax=Pseudomonas matsuisoli TaxID=1515666 RepID=A0A917UZ48_9PSED|nr:hypothetical protein GCM10009304_26260 [Pseudomonas matsuisoli]
MIRFPAPGKRWKPFGIPSYALGFPPVGAGHAREGSYAGKTVVGLSPLRGHGPLPQIKKDCAASSARKA